jgi:hypothetical protein
MYNKKVLSKAKAELNKAKAPKKSQDIITDPMGQWKYPGLPTRIPSNNITMEGVGYPVLGVGNNGQRKIMLPGADYTFPGADYVDEYPQMKKGGERKRRKTKSLSGTNKLMQRNPLLRDYKNREFDPNVDYFQEGGFSANLMADPEMGAMVVPSVGYSNGSFGINASTSLPVEQPMTYANNLNVNANYNKSLGKYGNLGLSANASYNKGTEPDYNASLRYSKQFGNGLGVNINADSPLKNIRDNGRVNVGLTYNFQDGGSTKLSEEEEKEFQKFYSTLPENLQSDDPTYDIRGYWNSEGRPVEFDYSQPKEDDGYYHAYSVNQNTGEYLKSPAHPTFQHAVEEDKKMGYRPSFNIHTGRWGSEEVAPEYQEGGTNKSSKGTVTNVIVNKNGSKTVQVKTKDGKYYEKVIPMDYWGELDKAKEEYNLQNTHEKLQNYTGVAAYPASVVSSIADFRDGKYTEGALGLIPFVGRNSKLTTTAARAVQDVALNAGVPLTKALAKAKSVKTLLPGVTGATQMQDIIPHEKDGGVYMDLTDDEIDEYRKGGYIVEDISVPELTQAQKGKSVSNKKSPKFSTYTAKNDEDYTFRKKAYDDSLALSNYILDHKSRLDWIDKNINGKDYKGHAEPVVGNIIDKSYAPEKIKKIWRESNIQPDYQYVIGNGKTVYPMFKTPTQKVVLKEEKPTGSKPAKQSKYPEGYQPYSLYGKVLDPEVYGYAESLNGRPVQVAQFADTYGHKAKMDAYKKSGKYPWVKQEGGPQNTSGPRQYTNDDLQTAQYGIEIELTQDEIDEYRRGGYIVEDISVPQLTKAQKGKFTPLQLPLDKTKSETTNMFQPIVNNAIRDKNVIRARENEERKRNIDRGVKAVKNSISAIEKNKTYTKKQKAELLKKETDKLFNIDQTQLEETGAVLNQTDQHSIKAAPEKTVGDYAERTWDIITNPFDAAKYSVSGGGIENMPWNYNKMKV